MHEDILDTFLHQELSPEYEEAFNPTDSRLNESYLARPNTAYNPTKDVKTKEDAEAVLSALTTYIANEGAKTLDSESLSLTIKGLSEIRTILSAGDLLREDTALQETHGKEQADEKKNASSKDNEDRGTDEASTVNTSSNDKQNQSPDVNDEITIKNLISRLEDYTIWSQNANPLDEDQVKYLARLKKLISRFNSARGLLTFCLNYAEKEGGSVYPSTIVFLLLIYFSKTPERYIPMFLTKPLYYTVDPQTKTRRYSFDDIIIYLKMQLRKKKSLNFQV